jgi:hypothetical protein
MAATAFQQTFVLHSGYPFAVADGTNKVTIPINGALAQTIVTQIIASNIGGSSRVLTLYLTVPGIADFIVASVVVPAAAGGAAGLVDVLANAPASLAAGIPLVPYSGGANFGESLRAALDAAVAADGDVQIVLAYGS